MKKNHPSKKKELFYSVLRSFFGPFLVVKTVTFIFILRSIACLFQSPFLVRPNYPFGPFFLVRFNHPLCPLFLVCFLFTFWSSEFYFYLFHLHVFYSTTEFVKKMYNSLLQKAWLALIWLKKARLVLIWLQKAWLVLGTDLTAVEGTICTDL